MERVPSFSFDDIPNSVWLPNEDTNNLNRSSSEWSFHKFLEEIPSLISSFASSSSCPQSCDLEKNDPVLHDVSIPSSFTTTVPIDPDEYQAVLKRNLELELASAAAALSPATLVQTQYPAPIVFNGSQVPDVEHSGLKTLVEGNRCSFFHETDTSVAAPFGILSPAVQKMPVAQIRSAASASSREQSNDEDFLEETEITNNTNPADEKLTKRKQFNKESARRSRERKQAQVNESKAKVSELRNENSSLMKRLEDIDKRFREAVINNKILTASIEALRAKVNVAADPVKQVNGLNQLFPAIAEAPNMSLPQFSDNPYGSLADAAALVRKSPNQHSF